MNRLLALGCVAFVGAALAPPAETARDAARAVAQPRIDRLYKIPAGEGAFAYGRISADGRYLAYTAQKYDAANARASRIQRVVDVQSGRVVFAEPGVDGYWSPDGSRLIYVSRREPVDSISILDRETGHVARNAAPVELGDYPSWAVRDGRDLIVTVLGNYYYLQDGRSVSPAHRIGACDAGGAGERPLVSRRGGRISVFAAGQVVVRNLTDCDYLLRTHAAGGKADFSYDERYLAFHAEKSRGVGYEIRIVDLIQKSVATVTQLPGSSLFPNWTRDGRLVFRYDSNEFRGFMVASDVLAVPFTPLPADDVVARGDGSAIRWQDTFVDPIPADGQFKVVLVWAPWNPHSAEAIESLRQASQAWRRNGDNVTALTAVEPSSMTADIARMRSTVKLDLPEVQTRLGHLARSGAANQIPAFLLFSSDTLIDTLLGTQKPEALADWVKRAQLSRHQHP